VVSLATQVITDIAALIHQNPVGVSDTTVDDVVCSSDAAYERCTALSDDDIVFLKAIGSQLPIVADVSRADILLYSWLGSERPIVLAHARPHSVAPVYSKLLVGQELPGHQEMSMTGTLLDRVGRHVPSVIAEGAPVVRQIYPVRRPGQTQVIGALRVETNLLEHERQRRRSPVFRRAVRQLQYMVQHAQLIGAQNLSPFGESDGLIVADRERRVRYASGIAANLYRRVGYPGGLVGHPLSQLGTIDNDLARSALSRKMCLEREEEAFGRYWIKKAIPLFDLPRPRLLQWLMQRPATPSHVLLIVCDTTESRRREQELRVKTALIQEIHHRVKNNLQTIAALLRIQARRMRYKEARTAIEEAVGRILSVAVIHEFLSNQDTRVINIKDVSNRILTQLRHGTLAPDQHIDFELYGPPIYLPARQATACALVINELLQNALEHGFKERQEGHIRLMLEDEGDHVVVRVRDNGSGLPENFDIHNAESLGLQIVQTLVREDLKGSIEIHNGDGAEAVVTFPKSIPGGE
jgi:two-component sensor histidine kinase